MSAFKFAVDNYLAFFSNLNRNQLYFLMIHLCRYTPISPPDSKGYFDLMIKVRGNYAHMCGELECVLPRVILLYPFSLHISMYICADLPTR